MSDIPEHLQRLVPVYEQLNADIQLLRDSEFSKPAAGAVFFVGLVLFAEVQFFHAQHPFWGGVGATLAAIGGFRWLYLRSRLKALYKQAHALTVEFMAAGYYPPMGGRIQRAPASRD